MARRTGDTRTLRTVTRTLIAAGLGVSALLVTAVATAPHVSAAVTGGTVTYSAKESIPAPPPSDFATASGGDGWAVAMTPTAVYNVFHHDAVLQVACHLQSNAQACWSPKTITDGSGNNFTTPGQPGLWLDQATGHLYVFATRVPDDTAGVVCIDTTQPASATGAQLFCGFTALSAVGDAPLGGDLNASMVSDPVVVGSNWYAFNEAAGTQSGTRNTMLCFSLATFSACPAQPYAVDIDGGSVTTAPNGFLTPSQAGFGSQIVLPVSLGSTAILACFNAATDGSCGGSWPVDITSLSYNFEAGAPFPILDSAGAPTGLCLAFGTDPCWSLSGTSVATPSGLASAVTPTEFFGGPALTIGDRVYLANGNSNSVDCFDYSTGASCPSFPKLLTNLDLPYTVNADPQRPTCIWVNSDSGADEIQNFDAYTGGACGQGPVRVLAAGIVAPYEQCIPANYTSIQVTAPARSSYSSGTVQFENFDGQAITSIPTQNLDATGSVNLAPLDLTSASPLPQFLITLNGAGSVTEVDVTLTWTGTYSADCVSGGQTVTGTEGYRLAASDGGVFSFGHAAFYGSMTGQHLNGPMVGIAATPDDAGYWMVASDGGVFSFGDAVFHGSLGGILHLNAPIVGIASTPSGKGYWLVASDGGVFSFGDAQFHGSLGNGGATAAVVGIASTPSGKGYWLTSADGNVYPFGDAASYGSMHGTHLDGPVVGIASSHDGLGYWLVASDGGVFAFGDAPFHGSMFGKHLNGPEVAMQPTPSGNGYWLDASDGGVFAFGDADFLGCMAGSPLNAPVGSLTS
jgi:hypothetical protein